jgi:hypothetical protein
MKEWRRAIGASAYASGVSACLDNGRSLIDESHLLLEAGHISRATLLAILALEEGDNLKRL